MAKTLNTKIRKAIIPVAGMGTRFLPATKAQPKEMLPVVDKPVIQYIVEEAVAAGIEEIIFVTAIGKRAIEDHFDRNFELEYRLEQKKKLKELEMIEDIGKLAKFAFVRQAKPLGDGHAILAAAPFVGNDESVAILFGDDIITGKQPAIGELIATYERYHDPVVAIQEVPREKVSSYGVIAGVNLDPQTWEITTFVEKPSVEEAPSNLAVVGRYVITPDIMRLLASQEPGKDGEIRLADAFTTYLAQGRSMYGCKFSGNRYDCGNKLQFIIAQIELGLDHPEVSQELRQYLTRFAN
ncbi:MAG: UTP--glucose-1-phosphate uridylyltransferase GalU [Candidatus Uhrbacteria bacterium]|nr:UTP--glucose-1-phosphate uridylyltransferase GalU [Candidatus Uhrbacteria bacterium]